MKIPCTISMPQFKNGVVQKMHEQSGTFDTDTLKFTPDEFVNGNYVAQFDSQSDLEKYLVKKTINN